MTDESDTNYYYNTTIVDQGQEDDEDDEELDFEVKKSASDYRLWDSFQDPPTEEASASSVDSKCINRSIKLLKIVTYWLVLITVACSCVLSKLSLLLMTSNVSPERTRTRFCDFKAPDRNLESTTSNSNSIAWQLALIISFSVPELATWLKSLRICFFKKIKNFSWKEFLAVFIAESFYVIGMCWLCFSVLPELNSFHGVMVSNLMCFVPSVLCMLSRPFKSKRTKIRKILDYSSIFGQLLGLFVFPLTVAGAGSGVWLLPLAGLMISVRWWENFVTYKSQWEPVHFLTYIRDKCFQSRYKIYALIAPYKIFLFLSFASISTGTSYSSFFDHFELEKFTNFTVKIHEIQPIFDESLPDLAEVINQVDITVISSTSNVILWTIAIQIFTSWTCYIFSKFACKIQIEIFSFSLPISLAVPLTITALTVLTGMRHADSCTFHGFFPDFVFFSVPKSDFLWTILLREFGWLWLCWLLAQIWTTRHLWRPKGIRNASTEKLFVLPLYDGFFVDQSMAMNRRREECEQLVDQESTPVSPLTLLYDTPATTIDAKALASSLSKEGVTARDQIPQIFVCATMWHETKEELLEFLKSILRLDEDQCARRLAMKYIQPNRNEIDKEYYELETHIFFDDAFVGNKKLCESPEATPINSYVKLLINNVEQAAWEVYKVRMKIAAPVKILCPYGGRLQWTLPGGTRMIAHLKDKNKIRHKKRWSQVMYMYYLLGYRIMQLPDASPERKRVIAQNTFLLALDGDIDFQPRAMTLLVDRMRSEAKLGAACGRIHPVGRGPMVWYQVFEYAIGHWLQKATEHVIGCVLCSPGCFSLFRARALMENGVMRKYTTKSDQARHYVQYDQGEDRWLCTLVLKQSFRVEYCAASDAYTHAPEGFNEFYNQRRRWVPSTIANILDLLGDAGRICAVNSSISRPYIVYQTILMFGTIIGPGTIFLMMVSAVQAVFLIDIYIAFVYNFVPLLSFMLICYLCPQKVQLIAAFIISIIYALIMMAVMVGIMIQVIEDGIMAPSSMFFMAVTLQIIVTGLLHPQEMGALPAGFIYYVTIPCMYMLLTVYSVFNMNDVSWGTRENPQEVKSSGPTPQKPRNKFQKLLSYFRPHDPSEEDGSIDVSCAGLFRCMFCTHKKQDDTSAQLLRMSTAIEELTERIRRMEPSFSQDLDMELASDSDDFEDVPLEVPTEHKQLLPDWLYDPDLKDGDTETISASEEQFWMDLIEKYLRPLDMTDDQKTAMQDQLKSYRDLSAFAFTMSNALFVLIVFLLQLNKEYLHVRWPFDVHNEIMFDQASFEFTIRREYKNLEPISMLFVAFFGIVLVVQFLAMLFHRFATISQILANTNIDWYFSKRVKDTISTSELKKSSVDIVRFLQKPRPEWDDNDIDDPSLPKKSKKDTIHKLLMQHKKQRDWSNLETNFKREFFKDGDLELKKLNLSKKTMSLLDVMRKSMSEFNGSKKSSMNGGYPYIPTVDSCYSLATSDKDSFTIYQRSAADYGSLRPQLPLCDSVTSLNDPESGNRNLLPLKSALKKSKTVPAMQVNFSNGIDNYSFVNDDGGMEMKELAGNGGSKHLTDIHEEEMYRSGSFEAIESDEDEVDRGIEMKSHKKVN